MNDLINRLRLHDDDRLYREADELMSEAADALDVQAGSIEAVQAVNARQAERIEELEDTLDERLKYLIVMRRRVDELRAQLAALEADYAETRDELQEANDSLASTYHILGERDAQLAAITATEPDIYVHQDGLQVWGAKNNAGVGNNPNFTAYFARPMPAQDVTELVDALEKLARLGNGEYYGNSDGNMIARDALSKYKGAK